MFDRNNTTPDIPAEIIDIANAVVERLRNRKVPQIILPEPGTGLRVCNLVRCYLQALDQVWMPYFGEDGTSLRLRRCCYTAPRNGLP